MLRRRNVAKGNLSTVSLDDLKTGHILTLLYGVRECFGVDIGAILQLDVIIAPANNARKSLIEIRCVWIIGKQIANPVTDERKFSRIEAGQKNLKRPRNLR